MITKEQLFTFADYEIRALNEDCFILERKGSVQSDKLITLNKTAAYVWNHLLGRVFSIETVASLLSQAYEIDMSIAEPDAIDLINAWLQASVITPLTN